MESHQYEEPEDTTREFNPAEYVPFTNRPIRSSEKTQSWLENFHGRKKTKGAKLERIVTVVLLITLLFALIAWGIFGYSHMRKNNDTNVKKINELRLKFELLNHKFNTLTGNAASTPVTNEDSKREFSMRSESRQKKDQLRPTGTTNTTTVQTSKQNIIISIIGDGSEITMSAGKPIHQWEPRPSVHKGQISFYKKRYIKIQKGGLYILQARMFLKDNVKEKDSTLSYTISKYRRSTGSKSLVSAAVQSSSCSSACTLPVSTMAYLQKDDLLYLEVTDTTPTKFRMLRDKSSFSCYLLV